MISAAALVPDPENVVNRFAEEFEGYPYHVLLAPPPNDGQKRRRKAAA